MQLNLPERVDALVQTILSKNLNEAKAEAVFLMGTGRITSPQLMLALQSQLPFFTDQHYVMIVHGSAKDFHIVEKAIDIYKRDHYNVKPDKSKSTQTTTTTTTTQSAKEKPNATRNNNPKKADPTSTTKKQNPPKPKHS